MNKKKHINYIIDKVKKHDSIAAETISLIASGNVVSPFIHNIMNTDLLYRAAEGKRQHSRFPGLDYFYDIEEFAEKDLSYIFNADFAELRPISGTLANIIIYTAVSNIGDYVLVPSIKSGSHVSQAGQFLREMRDYKFIHPKLVKESFLIDMEDCRRLISNYKPSIVFFGGSVCLEWQDLKDIVKVAHKNNCTVVYDASHVAGLIATGAFPNPMDYGIDLMTMTTCKTIPGPSHSWIFGKRKYQKSIEKLVFPGFISGGHLQEYIGAILSLYEIMHNSNAYGEKIINYSNKFASILEQSGFKFLKTSDQKFTNTHQIISYFHKKHSVKQVVNSLAKINILVSENYLPESFSEKKGIRWGTQEIVKIGADKINIINLAELIIEFLDEKSPNVKKYIKRVSILKREIEKNYCSII